MRFLFDTVYEFISSFFAKPVAKIRKKSYKKGRLKTIKETLSNLNNNFTELTRATAPESCIDKSIVKGMKKLGPYVPPADMEIDVSCGNIDPKRSYPSQVFVCTNQFNDFSRKIGDHDKLHPNFLYAERLKKSPHWVEPTKRTVFSIAICWPIGKGNKSFWTYYYVGVNKEGGVKTLKWQQEKRIIINKKNSRSRSCYTKKVWEKPETFNASNPGIDSDSLHVGVFCACMRFWETRNKMWNILVKKNDVRMTFCVDARDTKNYFKDRELITTEAGARKKIIHFVEGHERKTKTGIVAVREHIRGERQFNWNNYWCNVKSPKFLGMTMDDFNVDGEQDDQLNDGMIGQDKLAAYLTPLLDEKQANVYS